MESWSTRSSAKSSVKGALYVSGGKIPGTLGEDFYSRHTLKVARDLLGKLVVVRADPQFAFTDPRAGVTAGRIVETEAYRGDDPASHSCRGRTSRTEVMFGRPGRAYVYFIYGNYEMLNFVTEKEGFPGAVLIRALEPVSGVELMQKRRPLAKKPRMIANGPGRLCQALGIRMDHKGESLWGPSIFVVDDGVKPKRVSLSSRIGIKEGLDRDWRFFVTGNSFVSGAKASG